MRLTPKMTKENGFPFYSLVKKEKIGEPRSIEVLYFDEIYLGSSISQSEYLIQRIEKLNLPLISYLVEGNSCWNIGKAETLRIILYGKKSYKKAIKLIKFLQNKYSISIENISLNFEDKSFIKEIIKAT